MVSLSKIRIDINGLAQAGSGIVEPRVWAHAQQCGGEVAMSLMHRWLNSGCLSERLDRFVDSTKAKQRYAEMVVRDGVVRPNTDCPAHANDGLVMPALGHRKQSQIQMDFGVTWINRQRTLVALRGFGGATQAVECVSQGHECICKIRP